ncbi:MAG: triose-phosphate isomerase [Deltaproteobacteria bacterium]|nr:MAG: triose-phosphate isomerase [Deltaproteobacteria bacterium]
MYRGVEITPPFFEIGPKAYLYGRELLKLARHADKIGKKYDVQMIITPQYVDIPILAREMEHVLVFAQHMDSLEVGRGVGSVLPEALKAAGAAGVMLNHAEKRLLNDELERTIRRADQIGLATMVCADTLEDAAVIAQMEPNIIIAESPDLIGVGRRDAKDRLAIRSINEKVWKMNPDIRVLHGAGIRCGRDVYDVIASGAQGTGSTSGIILSDDPFGMVEEMARSVREAWDTTH